LIKNVETKLDYPFCEGFAYEGKHEITVYAPENGVFRLCSKDAADDFIKQFRNAYDKAFGSECA